jgi:hypothetical protein
MCELCVGDSILVCCIALIQGYFLKGYYVEKLLHCPLLNKGLLTVL